MTDWRSIPVPKTMRGLARDKRGYPIPFTILVDKERRPHFTVNDGPRQTRAALEKRCAICGNRLGRICWLVGGPASAFHADGAYVDLAQHQECKTYSLQVCPYLSMPNYLGRIDDATVDHSKLVDPGMISMNTMVNPKRPALFVAVAAADYQLIDQGDAPPIVKPKRPYLAIEYWQDGERLPEERGQMLAALALSPDRFDLTVAKHGERGR